MEKSGLAKLMESFADMPDPRVVGRTEHYLLDILVLMVCAVVCGADNWEAVEMWGEAKLDWLRQYIPLKNGIPVPRNDWPTFCCDEQYDISDMFYPVGVDHLRLSCRPSRHRRQDQASYMNR